MEWASEAATPSEADEASDNYRVVTVEAPEAKKPGKTKQASAETAAAKAKKPGKTKQASAETAAAKTLASIADGCEDVLAFLQAVAVKSPQVFAAPEGRPRRLRNRLQWRPTSCRRPSRQRPASSY